jgi:hypothetical protein
MYQKAVPPTDLALACTSFPAIPGEGEREVREDIDKYIVLGAFPLKKRAEPMKEWGKGGK